MLVMYALKQYINSKYVLFYNTRKVNIVFNKFSENPNDGKPQIEPHQQM